MNRDNLISGIQIFIVGSLILSPFATLIGVGTSFESKFEETQNIMIEQKSEFEENVSKSVNLKNFNIASLDLHKENNNDFILKIFGSSNVQALKGITEAQYFNLIYNIPIENAQQILNTVEKYNSISKNGSEDHNRITIDKKNYSDLNISDHMNLNKINDIIIELYDNFNVAVNNAYSKNVEKVSEASSTNNAISECYRYSRPEVVSNVSGSNRLWGNINTTFINCGVVTTNISQVVKDNERNVSYFFIDTLQGRENNGKMITEKCQARVEIEGTNLSQEEVYAKFIAGEYSNFIEIIREPINNSYIINNELVDDIENIQLF